MSRRAAILLFMLLAMTGVFSQTNTFTVTGKILDAGTKAPVRNVNIGINGSLSGAVSDSAGTFSLQTSGQSVVLNFFILGYEKKAITVSRAFNGTLAVELTQKLNTLAEVSINASRVETVSRSKRFHVLDYDFYNGNILMITYVELNKAKLVLISRDSDTLGYKKIPSEPNRLFKDCLGNLHVVCRDSIYQAFYNGHDLSFLPAKSIRDFENVLLPCVAQDSSHFYVVEKYGSHLVDPGIGMPFYSNPLALSYVHIHKKERQRTRFIAIADEHKIAMSEDEEDFERRKSQAGMNTFGDRLFAEKMIFTEIYAPLFHIDKALYLFDCVNGKLKCFDRFVALKYEVPVSFHKSLQFLNEMQVDPVSRKAFALFESGGLTELREINLSTGAADASYKIPFPFVSHVKVYDSHIYFIRKEKGDDNTRYLSRMSLD